MFLALVRLVGPHDAVEIFGVRLVGVDAHNGRKLLFSIGLIVVAILLRWGLNALARLLLDRVSERAGFWVRQAVRLTILVILIVGLISVWFDDPTRLATALGLVTAGLAFALQKVVTSLAGYFVILRGATFTVGDRITMGGVRGDVVALGFFQTTIMEMGQPPAVQGADPAMWVQSRQFTAFPGIGTATVQL
jgi:small-conductance mechanosensitive channel